MIGFRLRENYKEPFVRRLLKIELNLAVIASSSNV